MKRIITALMFMYGAVNAQCVTDSFTVDNFNDHVIIPIYERTLPLCDAYYCVPCSTGNNIWLPPFVQEVSVYGDGNVHVWLLKNCDSVYVDSCVKITPSSPFRVKVDGPTGSWSLKLCSDVLNTLSIGSEPYLSTISRNGLYSALHMCEGIIIAPAPVRKKRYKFQ